MFLHILLMVCGALSSVSLLSSRTVSMQESLQLSLEAAEVFKTLEQTGGSSGQRSDALKTVFSCMHALAHRISSADRLVLTRLELAELLVELAESVESADLRISNESLGSEQVGSDDMPSVEEQLGQTFLQQLYAEPNHQERVSFVEKILAASDSVEWFFCALFNKVSSVVAGTLLAVEDSLVGALNCAAQLAGFSSGHDAVGKISEATLLLFDALENTTIQVLQSTQDISSQLIITAGEQAQEMAVQSLNLAEAGMGCVSENIQGAVTSTPIVAQAAQGVAVNLVQAAGQGTQEMAAQSLNLTEDGINSVSEELQEVLMFVPVATQAAQSVAVSLVQATGQGVQDIAGQSLNLAEEAINSTLTQLQNITTGVPATTQDLEADILNKLEAMEDEFNDASYDEENRSEALNDFLTDDYSERSFLDLNDSVVAPLTAQEAILVRAVLNFDQQEILARSILVTPDYSAPVNVELAPFVNSLCHQVKRSGLQEKMGKHVRYLCNSASDNDREEKLNKLLADAIQSEEVCREVVATAGALVIDQAAASLSSLKVALEAITLSLR